MNKTKFGDTLLGALLGVAACIAAFGFLLHGCAKAFNESDKIKGQRIDVVITNSFNVR